MLESPLCIFIDMCDCYLVKIPTEGNLLVAIVLGLFVGETHRYPKISFYQRQDSDSDSIINFSCVEVKYKGKEN